MKLKEKSFTVELNENEVRLLADVLTEDIRETETAYGREGGEALYRRLSGCRDLRNAFDSLVGQIHA